MPVISKSSFIRGLKCPKSLWLHIHLPDEKDEVSYAQQKIFDNGNNIGKLAQQLFPGGIDASRGEPANYTGNIAYTRHLMKNGCEAIYEAAFGDENTLCYLDILARVDGDWQGFEVKATAKVKEYHLNDTGFQYYTIRRSGTTLKEISVVHLNNQYIRRGELDIPAMFSPVPVTRAIRKRQKSISEKLREFQQMLLTEETPGIPMGNHCYSPYPCDYINFCLKSLPPQPPPLNLKPSTLNQPAQRNQKALEEFLAKLEYPLFFMDFETFMPAVPYYQENRPYQKIPFQYSLHKVERPGTDALHFNFLADPPDDPRPAFIRSLLNQLGSSGTILVWNQTFEKGVLSELGRDFPEFNTEIQRLMPRVSDLMIPFKKKHLYTPEMNGSYSLKSVVPALVPELSYKMLEINDGGMASSAYEKLVTETDAGQIATIRKNLLDYCGLDTWSMVKILDCLR
jgi:hypothetical protein